MEAERLIDRFTFLAELEPPGYDANPFLVGGRPMAPPAGSKVKYSEVMILLHPDSQGNWHLPLIKRTEQRGSHRGQMALPGGKKELFDKFSGDAAKRELQEELGVPPNTYRMVKALSPLYIPPSRYWVQAHVAISHQPLTFVPDAREVASIHQLPWNLIFPNLPVEQAHVTLEKGKTLPTTGIWLHNEWVWGATAIMLGEFHTWCTLAKIK